MRPLTLALMGLLATPAFAEELDRIDTPSGPAVMTRTEFDTVVTVGEASFTFEGIVYGGFEEKVGDVVLMQLATGGTACPAMYAWLDPRPGSVRVTPEFGTCSDLHQVSWDAETVTVTLPSMEPGKGPVAFVWDGKTEGPREVQQEALPSGLPPGADAEAWEGRFGLELLEGADWRPVLVAMMGEAALLDAQRIVVVGHPFEAQGDWLVSTGCQPHLCDVTAGAVAIHRTDGRVVVAIWEPGIGVRVFGDTAQGVPPGVEEVMAKG